MTKSNSTNDYTFLFHCYIHKQTEGGYRKWIMDCIPTRKKHPIYYTLDLDGAVGTCLRKLSASESFLD